MNKYYFLSLISNVFALFKRSAYNFVKNQKAAILNVKYLSKSVLKQNSQLVDKCVKFAKEYKLSIIKFYFMNFCKESSRGF